VEDHIPNQLGQNRTFNGAGAGGYGDEVWAQPAGYGGPNFFFFEDWYCDNSTGSPFSANGGWDANTGGKFVIRHCHLFNIEILCHGTEGVRARGGRAQEIYNNDYHWSYLTTMDGVRSGTLVVHDNTYDDIEPQGYGLQTYRMIFGYNSIWEGATGANPWDYNVTEPDGTHIDGHPPYLFESGTVSSAVNGDNGTMTDSTKNWTTGQWTDYALRRPSDGATWLITGNTNNSLNTRQWGDPCCIQNWNVNDTYEIHKVLQALDQPGAGASDPISGANPTPTWLHQVREGCYSWNNVYMPNGHHKNWRPESPGLLEGRDYFSDTPLPGYAPYTYPHPLTDGGGTSPTPTPSATTTPTATPTPSPTSPPSPTPVPTPSATPTATPTPSATISPTPSPTATPTPSATTTPVPGGNPRTDFNGDGHPDYLLYNGTRQTAVWYLNNNVYIGGAYAPTLPVGWRVIDVADFNRDGHSDYALFNASTRQTAIWYLSGVTFIGGAYGPTLPAGWELVATGDFNNDGKPDYVLYNASTHQTAVWYLNNNVYVGGGYGPTLPPGWTVVGAADFDRDGHPDYLLFHPSSGYTAIGYLSGLTLIGTAWGPVLPSDWLLVATADFNGDSNPDYVLYKPTTRQTAILYLNNNVYVSGAYGPTLSVGWSLVER
jgi:hypothetical protein